MVSSVVSAAVSLPTTKIMLQNFLDDVAADTARVLEVGMEGAISNSEKKHKNTCTPGFAGLGLLQQLGREEPPSRGTG